MDQLLRLFPIHLFLLAILAAAVTAAIVARRLRIKQQPKAIPVLAWAAFSFGAVMTASITLLSYTPGAGTSGVLDLSLGLESPAQNAVNLLLLWWIALPLPLVRDVGVLKVAGLAAATSVSIELLQFVLPTGRSTALMDVLLNTGGALVLAVIAVYLIRPLLTQAQRSASVTA